jgi:hypothetical protein
MKEKKGKTGFICDYDFFMRHSCEKCPIARLCQEFEEKKNKEKKRMLIKKGR